MPTIPPDQPPDLRPDLRVLVVDDSPISRRLAEVLLVERGLEVVAAEDGPAALDALASEPFDLVLLDGMMPGLDGPAIAREVRRREAAAALAPIPIIALTASVLPEDRSRMLEAGMDDHLAKPFSAAGVDAALVRWLPPATRRRSHAIPATVDPTAGRASRREAPVVDVATVARLEDLGDASLVGRIVRLLLADAAARVAQADDAVTRGDRVELGVALGALLRLSANLGAAALGARAEAILDEVRRRQDRGVDPFAPALGPTGLEPLLDAASNRLLERFAREDRPG